MKSFVLAVMSVIFVSGCASSAALRTEYNAYRYNGEKYGKVLITQSESVAKDARKGVRIDEMSLDRKIISQLKAANIFDESSQDTIKVTINSIYIKNAFNAVMFGALAGPDSLKGSVSLNKGDSALAVFDIDAAYGLGGTAGGQNETRLGWLSDKFAEQTINMILGKK